MIIPHLFSQNSLIVVERIWISLPHLMIFLLFIIIRYNVCFFLISIRIFIFILFSRSLQLLRNLFILIDVKIVSNITKKPRSTQNE